MLWLWLYKDQVLLYNYASVMIDTYIVIGLLYCISVVLSSLSLDCIPASMCWHTYYQILYSIQPQHATHAREDVHRFNKLMKKYNPTSYRIKHNLYAQYVTYTVHLHIGRINFVLSSIQSEFGLYSCINVLAYISNIQYTATA